MADTGLVLCGTGANISGSGTDWDNPSNITAEDSNYAYADINKNGGLSDYLRATNFSFSVPSGATVDGVEVQIHKEGETSVQYDEYVYLVEGGSIISGCENKAQSTPWPETTPATSTYGGTSDTWSCSLSDTIVNSSTFGVQIMAEHQGLTNRRWVAVYWIKIKVYYTEAGGGSTYHVVAVSAGSGDASASTKTAISTESGSEGISSANVNAKAAKSADSEAEGYGEAWAETMLGQRLESESAGTSEVFFSAGDKIEHEVKGAAKGESASSIYVWQLKNIHGFGYGGSSGASKVKGSKRIAGQGVGVSDAVAVASGHLSPFTGMAMTDRLVAQEVFSKLAMLGWQHLDHTPYLAQLVRAIAEVFGSGGAGLKIHAGSVVLETLANIQSATIQHNLGKANMPVSIVNADFDANGAYVYGINEWNDNAFTFTYYGYGGSARFNYLLRYD